MAGFREVRNSKATRVDRTLFFEIVRDLGIDLRGHNDTSLFDLPLAPLHGSSVYVYKTHSSLYFTGWAIDA